MANFLLDLRTRYDDEKKFQRGDPVEIGDELRKLKLSEFIQVIAKAFETKEEAGGETKEYLHNLKKQMLQASEEICLREKLQEVTEARKGWQKREMDAQRNWEKYRQLEVLLESQLEELLERKEKTP